MAKTGWQEFLEDAKGPASLESIIIRSLPFIAGREGSTHANPHDIPQFIASCTTRFKAQRVEEAIGRLIGEGKLKEFDDEHGIPRLKVADLSSKQAPIAVPNAKEMTPPEKRLFALARQLTVEKEDQDGFWQKGDLLILVEANDKGTANYRADSRVKRFLSKWKNSALEVRPGKGPRDFFYRAKTNFQTAP